MDLVFVGDNQRCNIPDVVLTIMDGAPALNVSSMRNIMLTLGTEPILQSQISINLALNHQTVYEALEKVLEEWRGRTNNKASLDALIYVLRNCNLINSVEKLRERFYFTAVNKTGPSSPSSSDTRADLSILDRSLVGKQEKTWEPADIESQPLRSVREPDNIRLYIKNLNFNDILKIVRKCLQVVSVLMFILLVTFGLLLFLKSSKKQ